MPSVFPVLLLLNVGAQKSPLLCSDCAFISNSITVPRFSFWLTSDHWGEKEGILRRSIREGIGSVSHAESYSMAMCRKRSIVSSVVTGGGGDVIRRKGGPGSKANIALRRQPGQLSQSKVGELECCVNVD